MLLNSLIEGKSITRFPVYLRSKDDPTVLQVAKNLDDIQRLLKKGKWINAGVAPFDNNRAIGDIKPKSKYTVTKTFEVSRIVERDGNVLRLFPEGEFRPSVQWLQTNRPKVGGYLLRHDNDYYTAVSEVVFNRQYSKGMNPETLEELTACLKKGKVPSRKHTGKPVAKETVTEKSVEAEISELMSMSNSDEAIVADTWSPAAGVTDCAEVEVVSNELSEE